MNIGVLGLGFMGSTHLQALSKIPDVRVAAVMDTNEQRLSGDLSGIQGNLGGPGQTMDFSAVKKYRSIEEIVADPGLDAVDVCLPTVFHAPATMAALRAGKHVLCEKPMALNGADADAMCAEAARAGRILMAAQVLRFIPAYAAMAMLVKSGQLGPIRWALFRRRTSVPTWGPWEFDKSKSGGGVFDLLIHDVDMALYLFGVPRAVSSTGHEDMPGGIDLVTSTFHYDNVPSVTITGGWHHVGEYPFSMDYTVAGDKGIAEFSSAGRPATVYWADGRWEPLPAPDLDCYGAEIQYFVECCQAGVQPATCPPAESALAVKMTKLMVEARSCNGQPVTVSA